MIRLNPHTNGVDKNLKDQKNGVQDKNLENMNKTNMTPTVHTTMNNAN